MSGQSGLVPRILIVDDDADIRTIEATNLTLAGYSCREAADGMEALTVLATEPVDMILLDVGMPVLDGVATLRAIRAAGDTPVILVTCVDDTAHIQLAFELGADDYVVKPFQPGELVARVGAVLRRCAPRTAAVAAVEAPSDPGLQLDRAGRRVVIDGAEVIMTRREFDVLATLAAEPGKAFSRDDLLRQVWASQAGWQDPATVTEHVHRLRSKLSASGRGRCIETVRGVGYRFQPDGAEAAHASGDDPTEKLGDGTVR